MNQQPASSPPSSMMRAIMILYLGITMAALLFMLIALVVNQSKGAFAPELGEKAGWLKAALAVVCLGCLLLARKKFAQKLAIAKEPLKPLADKLQGYMAALILYLCFCEVPVIAAIIIFLLTGDFSFLIFGAVILGFMLAILPVKRRVIQQLELTMEEQAELEQ